MGVMQKKAKIMKIIKAKKIITANEKFEILDDKAVLFDESILRIGDFESVQKAAPNAPVIESDILTPALINAHVHLEFSANNANLHFGDFVEWLKSIVENRETLSEQSKEEALANALKALKRSGVGTIGEISSFGGEAGVLAKSGLRVVFFNEVVGSNASAAEANFERFLARFEASGRFESPLFTNAVSVHSPYSVAPKLAKSVVDLARQKGLAVATHFLESRAESEWLRSKRGGFLGEAGRRFGEHLRRMSPNAVPFWSPREFVELFAGVRTLFIHCVFAETAELAAFGESGFVVHCPRSNLLLGSGRLAVEQLGAFSLATDGLSSNVSLNLFDEMRAALFLHAGALAQSSQNCDFLELLAKRLFCAVSRDAAKALGGQNGEICVGKRADFALFDGEFSRQFLLNFILKTTHAKGLFVAGKGVEV